MSVDLHEELDGRVFIVRLSGKLTREDYETFVPALERRITQHGKIGMLVEMHDFHGWTAGALWEDVKFDVRHFADIDRLALVGDWKWEKGMAVFCKPFTRAEVRFFGPDKRAEALQWVREGREGGPVAETT